MYRPLDTKKKRYSSLLLSIFLCFLLSTSIAVALTKLPDPVWTQSGTDGLGTPKNTHIHNLTTFKSHLYTGTMNGEGAQILRTSDGKEWELVVGPDLPGTNGPGFGNLNNQEVHEIKIFKSELYAVTYNTTNGTEVWRSSNGTDWEKVVGTGLPGLNAAGFGNKGNIDIQSSAIFKGYLYVGTWNDNGAEVWRTADGNNWEKVNQSGFGDKANDILLSMTVLGDHIYAATQKAPKPGEVWRSADGTNWTQCAPGGFDNEYNSGIECMVVFNSELYAGTSNYYGAEIFKTTDGQNWQKVMGSGFAGVNSAGFGNGSNKGIWALYVFEGNLYAGVYNDATGAEIWKSGRGADWTKVIGRDLTGINSPGFDDPNNIAVDSFGSFDGYLYAATDATIYDGTNTYDKSKTGFEVWRIAGENVGTKKPVKEKSSENTKEQKTGNKGISYLLICGLGTLGLLIIVVAIIIIIIIERRQKQQHP